MACITQIAICVPQHDAVELYIDVVDLNSEAVDISTASEIEWIVSTSIDDAGADLLTKTLSGTTLSLQTDSQILIPLSSADMGLAAGLYYHELRVLNAIGDPATLMAGVFEIDNTRIGDP